MKPHWNLDDMPQQSGKTVLITGANDGLGLHMTRAFAQKQASALIMACRNQAKAAQAKAEVLAHYPEATLDLVQLDLADLASVKACSETVLATYGRLDIVMCNAGIMAVPYGKTKNGLELQMGINYYGHFALVRQLMPLLKNTPGARVVTTSSLAEKLGRLNELDKQPTAATYNRWLAYGDSKLAILMLAFMLDEKFKREGIAAKGVSAHPGFAKTNLRYSRLETEQNPWQRLQLRFYELLAMPAERGVLPLLYAATDPAVAGGEYIGVDGFGEVQGDPKRSKAQKRAYDPAQRQKLWERSEQLTKD